MIEPVQWTSAGWEEEALGLGGGSPLRLGGGEDSVRLSSGREVQVGVGIEG